MVYKAKSNLPWTSQKSDYKIYNPHSRIIGSTFKFPPVINYPQIFPRFFAIKSSPEIVC